MAFDFNNIEDNDNVNDLARAFSFDYLVKDTDALDDLYMAWGSKKYKDTLLEYIGKENIRNYLIKLSDVNGFDEVDRDEDSSSVTGYYSLSYEDYNKLVKNPDYKNDPKFLAFCSLFLDDLGIFSLSVGGTYEVSIDAPDDSVGYGGGIEVSGYDCDNVTIEDLTVPNNDKNKLFVSFDIVYPIRKATYKDGKRTYEITNEKYIKNTDIGKAFDAWVELLVDSIDLNSYDYDYDPYDDYDPCDRY